MKQENIETDLKYIQDETLRLSTSQPFFNGQLKVNAFEADYTCSVVADRYDIWGVFNFINPSQILPFCRIVPVFYVNGVRLDAERITQLSAYRVKVLYEQSRQVAYEYRFRSSVDLVGQTIEIKPYIITNDLTEGYTINGSWGLLR